MVSKTLVQAKANVCSDRGDFLPMDAGYAEVANKSAPKPLIGVNLDYRSARENSPAFSILSAGYYESITKAGGIPVAIPPLTDADDLQRVLDLLDGIVLCGGADLDPRRDGFMLHPAMRLLTAAAKTLTACWCGWPPSGRCRSWGLAAGCNCSMFRRAAVSSFISRKTCPMLCHTWTPRTRTTGTPWS